MFDPCPGHALRKSLWVNICQHHGVSTTVMIVKSKFGDSLGSKTDPAHKNETRAKALCHNI